MNINKQTDFWTFFITTSLYVEGFSAEHELIVKQGLTPTSWNELKMTKIDSANEMNWNETAETGEIHVPKTKRSTT